MEKKLTLIGSLAFALLFSACALLSGPGPGLGTPGRPGALNSGEAGEVDKKAQADARMAVATPTTPVGEALVGETASPKLAAESANLKTIDAFMFGYSQEELRLKAGETYTIKLTSSGGMHDLVIDELDVHTKQINTGDEDSVTFTVPLAAAGNTYKFYCSVGNHRQQGMEGSVIIQ